MRSTARRASTSSSGTVPAILNKVKHAPYLVLQHFAEKIWPSFRHSCGGVIIFSRDTSIESFVDYFVESGAVQPEQSLLWVNDIFNLRGESDKFVVYSNLAISGFKK